MLRQALELMLRQALELMLRQALELMLRQAPTFTGDGFRWTRSGTAGTHPGIARGARRRCRWVMAARAW
jgi:hypothetical protein